MDAPGLGVSEHTVVTDAGGHVLQQRLVDEAVLHRGLHRAAPLPPHRLDGALDVADAPLALKGPERDSIGVVSTRGVSDSSGALRDRGNGGHVVAQGDVVTVGPSNYEKRLVAPAASAFRCRSP